MGIEFCPIDSCAQWDTYLKQCAFSTVWQSWDFGQAMADCEGWRPVRLLLTEQGRDVALAQVLFRKSKKIVPIARIFNGPVFFDPDLPHERKISVLDALANNMREQRRIFYVSPTFSSQNGGGDFKQLRLTHSGEIPWSSIRVNLSPSLETLHKKLKKKWRACLRKSEKSNFELEPITTEAEAKRFFQHYCDIHHDRKFGWPPPDLVRALWRYASQDSFVYHFYVRREDRRVGAALNIGFGNVLLGLVGWSNEEGKQHHVNHFIEWHTIEYAKQAGFLWYDLGGANERNPGFTRFKRGIGGEEYQLGEGYVGHCGTLPCHILVGLARLHRRYISPKISALHDSCEL